MENLMNLNRLQRDTFRIIRKSLISVNGLVRHYNPEPLTMNASLFEAGLKN
jgi:hypothetical protein